MKSHPKRSERAHRGPRTNEGNRSKHHHKPAEYTGVISVTRRGVGYFPHEALEEDIEIAPEKLNTALNGDEVVVRTLGTGGRFGRMQGQVLSVERRAREEFVGTLVQADGFLTLAPDDARMYAPIRIPKAKLTPDSQEGYKALVKLVRWDDPATPPLGEIVRVLGEVGKHETEMQAALAAHGFDSRYPEAALTEARAIEAKRAITQEEITKRRDMRGIPTFTIDPVDAKDFDDALSLQELEDGRIEVGIHIADVTHYVRPGTALDTEARQRATSVYLVDRTIPMLPEVLSNDICSLRPDEDRLAFSAIFILNKDAGVEERWFGRTVIRSIKRFTYEAAQEALDTNSGGHLKELRTLATLALKLREKRSKNGAIAFDTDEVKFELDTNGNPIRAYVKEHLETMRIIEDWMLLANEEVATFIAKKAEGKNPMDSTFIYRIHDTPDSDRIEELRIFLRAIGHDFETPREKQISSRDINKLLERIKGTPEEKMIQMATLRSMAKAVYSHKNIGHFSLGFTHYTHFTSPIRRYPDMMVHRVLAAHLHNEPLSHHELEAYRKLAIACSEREVEAVRAERDSTKYMQVKFMSDKVGQEFDGEITGVTENGIFVAEKGSRAEGMVRVSALTDDYYEFDKKHYSLVGRKSKKTLRLGDAVRVKLLSADLDDRRIDWGLVG